MTMDAMQWAWTGYIGGSLLLLALCWWATSAWRPVLLARLLRVWLMVLLFVPAYADSEGAYLAPAWVVTFFIAAGEGLDAAASGYWPLLSAFSLSTAVLLIGALVHWLRHRGVSAADTRPVPPV
jgi:hypothetical protein